jgi:hypothetical protein
MKPTKDKDAGVAGSDLVPVVRDEGWIDAYEEQATDALRAKATRFASNRAAQIVRAGGVGDEDYIDDVVQSAFADTYTGRLSWDPKRSSLEAHVILAIKCRTRHDRDHIGERRYVSFDMHDRGRATAQTRAEVEASLASESRHDAKIAEKAERALVMLREIAVSEQADDVVTLLDAFGAGAYSKAEVLASTSLTAKQYRNARARLETFVKRLPADVARLYA